MSRYHAFETTISTNKLRQSSVRRCVNNTIEQLDSIILVQMSRDAGSVGLKNDRICESRRARLYGPGNDRLAMFGGTVVNKYLKAGATNLCCVAFQLMHVTALAAFCVTHSYNQNLICEVFHDSHPVAKI